MPVSPHIRYGGIERLVYEMAKTFQAFKERQTFFPWLDYDVIAVCTEDSVLPRGVIKMVAPWSDFGEAGLIYPLTSLRMLDETVYMDFSHSRVLGIHYPDSQQISFIWHDPYIQTLNLPTYNIGALSKWQQERFQGVHNQPARVINPICADPDIYQFSAEPEERVICVGKMHETKGALKAVRDCRAEGLKLDVVGAIGPGDSPEYMEQVRSECDGVDIVFHGEVDDQAKVELLQRAAMLYYPVSYGRLHGEAHSHKMVEAMMCGTPCLSFDIGAMSEVIEDNVTGWVMSSWAQDHVEARRFRLSEFFETALEINREEVAAAAMERYSTWNVAKDMMGVLIRLSEGQRWE